MINCLTLFTRDAFRLMINRTIAQQNRTYSIESSVILLLLMVGVITTIYLNILFIFIDAAVSHLPNFYQTLFLSIGSMIICLISEPYMIRLNNSFDYENRMYIEICSVILRCLSTFLFLWSDYGLLSHGFGHLLQAIFITLCISLSLSLSS
jgi:hypothetical protein